MLIGPVSCYKARFLGVIGDWRVYVRWPLLVGYPGSGLVVASWGAAARAYLAWAGRRRRGRAIEQCIDEMQIFDVFYHRSIFVRPWVSPPNRDLPSVPES